MKNRFSKLLSMLLTLAMIVSMIPAVLAADPVEAATFQQLSDAAAAGGDIKLTANITLTGKVSIAAGKTVALDLNGFTITSDDGATKYIENAGTLTVTDGSTEKTGGITVTGATNSARCIYNTGDLTIQGGTFSATVDAKSGYAIYSKSDKHLAIEGGTFRIEQTGSSATNSVDVFGLGGNGTVSISGSVEAEAVNQSGNSSATANAMYLFNSTKTKVTISGGSFTATSAADKGAVVRYPGTAGTPAVTLTGGEFLADNVICSGPVQGTLTVSGGSFTNGTDRLDVSSYVADGYCQLADGTVVVTPTAALSVTAGENGTIALPAETAYVGSSVTVTATPAEGYKFSHLLVNGTQVDGLTFTVPEADTVTVQGVFEEDTVPNPNPDPDPTPAVRKPTYHGITVEKAEGGVVKASAEKATINTVIDLEIIPEAGYVLESITVKKLCNGKNANVTDNSFYMPYSNVVITPVFKKA